MVTLLCAVAVVPASASAAADAPAGNPAAAPARSPFDPRRPPERELEIGVADGFTLAAVGDCIVSRPLSPMLATDPAFAPVVKILRDPGATFGDFENTAIDPAGF